MSTTMAGMSSKTPDNSVAYVNGRVYTVNASQPWAEAFIVSPTGIFTTVGSNENVRTIAAKDGLVIYDLLNHFVMPGIHDAHLHLLMAGMSKTGGLRLGLDKIIPHREAAQRVQEATCMCSPAHAFYDWLCGDVYQMDQFDRSHLDEAYPDTPIMIRGGGGHCLFLNTAALKASGYDIANEPDSKAAVLERRPDGSLTGEVAELAMTKAVLAYPKPKLAHIKRALKRAFTLLHRAGVTSCQDASSNTLLLHALRELEAEHALKCNVFTHIVYAPEMHGEEPQAKLHSLIDRADEFSSSHVHTRFIKMMLDGAPLPPYFTQCGLTEDGEVDESKIFLDDVIESVKKCDAKGLTVKIHATGEGSVRRALDAFEAARKSNPEGPRHEVAHCSGVHDTDHPRFPTLNVTAEMSPAMFFTHPATSASNGLMNWDFPTHLRHNAHLTIGSDWGVPEFPDLFPAMAGIVERVGNGDRTKGAQTLLRCLTLAGSEAVGREGELGSIETGKVGNFIVVDRDLSLGLFEGAKVLRTYFEGEAVWDAEF